MEVEKQKLNICDIEDGALDTEFDLTYEGCLCVALFYYTDIGESLRSRGHFLTAVDLGWPDPHPSP